MDRDVFQIAFWIISLLFVACSFFITIFGWKVTGDKARALAIKKDTHDSIDKALAALKDLEDSTYDYWLSPSPETVDYSLIVKHKRLIAALSQVSDLKQLEMPSYEILLLRRHATLDAETATRPIRFIDKRIKQFSGAATKIMSSALLNKTWRD